MKENPIQNQSGQLIVEAVLILVVLMGVSMAVANYFKENEVLKTMISGPWANLSGMLQNGVWATPAAGGAIHPNAGGRHVAIIGEPAK